MPNQETEESSRTRRVPLMPEFAIISTLLLIAAPVVLVATTLAAAAKRRLAERDVRGAQR